MKESCKTTGAEQVRWDLTDLYKDVDDPLIDNDIALLGKLAADFQLQFSGKLGDRLGDALSAKAELSCLQAKLSIFLFLSRSTDSANEHIQQRIGVLNESWSRCSANHLTFFNHELAQMDESAYQSLCESDPVVGHHRPYLDHLRSTSEYLLEQDVERALKIRDPFGGGEWSEYVEDLATELRFNLVDESVTLQKILQTSLDDPDAERRFNALKSLSTGLSTHKHDRLAARALNVVLGAKAVEDSERGYAGPMSARNLDNHVDDDTVEALHLAVAEDATRHARRYYRLVAKHLGVKVLKWSDRAAPMPFTSERIVTWQECVETVLAAYGSFSPTLRDLVQKMLASQWVDAPPAEGKRGGAFNYSVLLPSGEPRSYNLLNYMGSLNNVMTVAHELGHGVHGMLAAESQGALMFRSPTAYAETASIFGEMTTFNHLLGKTQSDTEKLSLLMSKSADFIGTAVRQISFSNFERRIHLERRTAKLKVADFNEAWMAETKAFYGEEGDIFSYEYADNLWCYIPHFFRPFYVYAYAFGELFTQSLYARREHYGDEFENMYLDLLRAGGSKNAVELMAPFGLDPREPDFWREGIESSIAVWLDEAEVISERILSGRGS
ncbi:MAG: oligoendopeptidase F [Halieaceae bacterium]|jgi:oligoendopeptidase F